MSIKEGLINQNGETNTRLSEGQDMSLADNQEDKKGSMGRDHSMCKDAEAGNVLINFGDPK